MKWKGIKLRHIVMEEIISEIFIKGTFYEHNMELKDKVRNGMIKYANHVQKLSKAARQKTK